jgi:membrane glycosyltransferase
VLAVQLRGEQRFYGGSARLWGSALLELLLSALQAPLRMLAHSLFVLSALTGLKLEWRSPSRQADAVAWGDAWARVGRLVLLPAALVALWMAVEGLALAAGWVLLLPLLLAVPLTVASASPAVGRRLEQWGLLWNPEARRPPRTLARAGEARAFALLAPPPQPAVATPGGAVAWSMGRPRALVAAGVLAFSVLGVMPRVGTAPEVPAWLQAQQGLLATWLVTQPAAEPKTLDTTDRLVAMRERPARRIDNAVRERARAAVQRALALEAQGTVPREDAGDSLWEGGSGSEGEGGWPEG